MALAHTLCDIIIVVRIAVGPGWALSRSFVSVNSAGRVAWFHLQTFPIQSRKSEKERLKKSMFQFDKAVNVSTVSSDENKIYLTGDQLAVISQRDSPFYVVGARMFDAREGDKFPKDKFAFNLLFDDQRKGPTYAISLAVTPPRETMYDQLKANPKIPIGPCVCVKVAMEKKHEDDEQKYNYQFVDAESWAVEQRTKTREQKQVLSGPTRQQIINKLNAVGR